MLSSHRFRLVGEQFCKFAEVLGVCRDVEFVFGTVRAAHAQAAEARDALEVSEEHLDLLPPSKIPTLIKGFGAEDIDNVTIGKRPRLGHL